MVPFHNIMKFQYYLAISYVNSGLSPSDEEVACRQRSFVFQVHVYVYFSLSDTRENTLHIYGTKSHNSNKNNFLA